MVVSAPGAVLGPGRRHGFEEGELVELAAHAVDACVLQGGEVLVHEAVRLRQPVDEHPGVVMAVLGMPDDDADAAAGDCTELVLEVVAGLGEEDVAADGGTDALLGPAAVALGPRLTSDQVRQEEGESHRRKSSGEDDENAGQARHGLERVHRRGFLPDRSGGEEERQGEEVAGQRVSL
ncbi:hypothetical protein [Streptomyces kronopolitis]|uniref:hypothetical protein n=1 Tax=Streptomyces kronopolitis TaxID=1612435 RepID=UPI003D95FFAE